MALRFGKQGGGIVRQRENDRAPGFLSLEGPSSGPSCRVKRPVGMSFTVVTTRVTASGSGEIIRPAALVRGGIITMLTTVDTTGARRYSPCGWRRHEFASQEDWNRDGSPAYAFQRQTRPTTQHCA